jgi:biopolymer transport protein ExbB/TolQ
VFGICYLSFAVNQFGANGMNLPNILQSAIYIISTSLLYPVIIILLGMVAFIIIEIGMFSYEYVTRGGGLKRAKSNDLENSVLEAKALIDEDKFEEGISVLEKRASNRVVYLFLDGVASLKERQAQNYPDTFSINLEKLLQKCDSFISKRLVRTKATVRLGPMFGLMGTLIPMGPALLALTRGDINTLAHNLIIAFGTTVLGLLIGSLSYIIYTTRKQWYDDDLNEITYICEVLFGGEK